MDHLSVQSSSTARQPSPVQDNQELEPEPETNPVPDRHDCEVIAENMVFDDGDEEDANAHENLIVRPRPLNNLEATF